VLQIRLRQNISSFGSKRDTPVSAIVIAPVEIDGHIVLPINSELRGTLMDVRRVGLGFSRETAMLNLRFDSLTIPGGQTQSLAGQIVAVDDSREAVDSQGRIHGIRATASPSSTVSGFAESAAGIDPMFLLFGLSSSLSVSPRRFVFCSCRLAADTPRRKAISTFEFFIGSKNEEM